MLNQTPDADKEYSGVLHIENIDLSLNIGISEEERSKKQDVSLSIVIYNASQGADDDYSHVICYDKVICKILDEIEGKEFNLIEYFAKFIMNVLEENFFLQNNIVLQVCKKPVIRGVQRNIKFELKNF